MHAPALDDDLRLGQTVEDLAVEEFILQLRVEALAVFVLPEASRFNVSRPGAEGKPSALIGSRAAMPSRVA